MVAKNPQNILILQYGDGTNGKKTPGVKLSSVTQPENAKRVRLLKPNDSNNRNGAAKLVT